VLCISEKLRRNVIRYPASTKVSRKSSREDLLKAFERARTQLAVAIAAEAKSTPLKRRQYYLDTADQMRRFARKLRAKDAELPPGHTDWQRVFETIRQLPVEGRALRLSQMLREIATDLE
jgi:hypothetical protein